MEKLFSNHVMWLKPNKDGAEDGATTEDPTDDKPDGKSGTDDLTVEQLNARVKALEKDIADKDAHISNLNEESKQRRIKLKEYEDRDEEARKNEMTEVDRLKTELEEATSSLTSAQAELRTLQVQNAVRTVKVTSDEKEFVLIDPADFTLPDDKDLKDIPSQLKALFQSKPHYFREAKSESGLSDDGSPSDENNGGKQKYKDIKLPRQRL